MNSKIINWLLDGPLWLKYAVETQLLNSVSNIKDVIKHKNINLIINRLLDKKFGLPAVKTGKISYTSYVFWDLAFLADIGLSAKDFNMEFAIEDILNLQSDDGTFVMWEEMKPNYFCISSIMISSIVKMGYKNDERIRKYIQAIKKSQRLDGGWHCAKSRSTGEKLQNTVSCPMDNLNILLLLGQYQEHQNNAGFNGGIDLLLNHWQKKSENWRPYGFGVGTQFSKLKYPVNKYGILRVMDVLSLFPYAIKSKAFINMLDFIHSKSDDGKYYAESIVKHYSDFDFGQKKEPSRWITFLVNRIDKQICKN